MIVDTLAIVAIFKHETRRQALLDELAAHAGHQMSAAAYVELTAVLAAHAEQSDIQQLLRDLDITVVDFTPEQAEIAAAAYRRYGRGSGHAAHLNLGDCFSYALTKLTDEPLLCIGNDFSATDIKVRPPR